MQGLKFPLEIEAGRFVTVSDKDKLDQNIDRIVNTEILSRIMEPNAGSIASAMLFRVPNYQVHVPILNKLKDAINAQEPRIRVESITLSQQGDSDRVNGNIYINVVYTVLNTGKSNVTEVEVG